MSSEAVFVMKIGDLLESGEKHDGRAPDYDDASDSSHPFPAELLKGLRNYFSSVSVMAPVS